jgi:hypothetical protein
MVRIPRLGERTVEIVESVAAVVQVVLAWAYLETKRNSSKK